MDLLEIWVSGYGGSCYDEVIHRRWALTGVLQVEVEEKNLTATGPCHFSDWTNPSFEASVGSEQNITQPSSLQYPNMYSLVVEETRFWLSLSLSADSSVTILSNIIWHVCASLLSKVLDAPLNLDLPL